MKIQIKNIDSLNIDTLNVAQAVKSNFMSVTLDHPVSILFESCQLFGSSQKVVYTPHFIFIQYIIF